MPRAGTTLRGAARRAEILATALELVRREGYPATTLGAIARELGVDTPHIVYYFGSREALIRELLERWDAETRAADAGASSDPLGSLAEGVRRDGAWRGIVQLHLAFAAESADPAHPAHDFVGGRLASTVDGIATVIAAGQASGAVVDAGEPRRLARGLVALAHGLQLQALHDPEIRPAEDLGIAIGALFPSGAVHPAVG
jgi:AcrR family transcriptional regulator